MSDEDRVSMIRSPKTETKTCKNGSRDVSRTPSLDFTKVDFTK